MEKKNNLVVNEEHRATLNTRLPQAYDREAVTPYQPPTLDSKLPQAYDRESLTPDPDGGLFDPLKDVAKGPRVPDTVDQRKQFFFTGEWVSDEDPLKIGEKNYQTLQNYRYRKVGIEGVAGYSKINPTALATHSRGRSGIQLTSQYATRSYVLAFCRNASASESRVWENRGVIPAQADFAATALWTDDAAASLGRFAVWPQGHVGYANGMESFIWGGDEKILNSLILCSNVVGKTFSDAEDHTENMQNAINNAANAMTVTQSGNREHVLVGSTRPLSGVRVYVRTANASASSLSVKSWNGTAWASVAGLIDGTASGGKTLAQTGFITWADTEQTARVRFIEGRLLYWYWFTLSAGSADIYQVTLKASAQCVKDIWDGIYRVPGQCQLKNYSSGSWVDFTMNAYTDTPAGWYPTDDGSGAGGYGTGNMYPGYYIPLMGNDAAHPLQIGFEEPICGLRFNMLGTVFGFTNRWTAGHSHVTYWTGATWVEPVGKFDTTVDATASPSVYPFNRSGVISWTPPSNEEMKSDFGHTLYYYQVYIDPQMDTTVPHHVWVDTIRGIPAPKQFPQAYAFPFHFQGRAMLCGLSGQENRVDYSMAYSPDVWNGDDSSFGAYGPLYFGGDDRLTCAIQLYNRFGSSIYNTAIFCKRNETYLLDGFDYSSWAIYRVSNTIGCPAPMTMATAEVAFSVGEGATRNIALWLSHTGPVIFDAGVLIPIRDRVMAYFNPQDSRCINHAAMHRAVGWVDSVNGEYNLLIPSGAGQVSNNVWLVYDLINNKWFEKRPTAAASPYVQGALGIVDTHGNRHTYGFRDNGHMMRLENGTTWDGAAIAQVVKTSDQVPTGDVWDLSRLRRVKVFSEAITEATSTTVKIFTDGSASPYRIGPVSLNGSGRYVRYTEAVGLSGLVQGWSYAFTFETVTRAEAKGAPLLGWGYTFRVQREDQ